jgi:hypothetical protein
MRSVDHRVRAPCLWPPRSPRGKRLVDWRATKTLS